VGEWLVDVAYGWVKAFHIIAVIAWMAGMLYLPRLFVYHCAAEKGSVQSENFKVMERRLLRLIINPAMIATWLLGLWLAWQGSHPPALLGIDHSRHSG
jgi:protoporphyrinogen IX oxidase